MEHSYPSKWHLWESRTTAAARESADPPVLRELLGPHGPDDAAGRLFAQEVLGDAPSGAGRPPDAEPYTLQWFLDIENQRHSSQGRWIPRLLEFGKHAGETLLGLGDGLGTDWLQYARHGASVVVCSASARQLALVRRNFELRGLGGRFLHAGMEHLPLDNASIDVVCVSNLLQDVGEPAAVVDEIFRVLKPGGKVLAVAPARYDVTFWARRLLPWQRWLGPGRPPAERPARQFSARGLRRLFRRFVEHRVHKRQLRRREVPLVWRWLPPSALQRAMGRFLVLKAFKPLSAAIAMRAAA